MNIGILGEVSGALEELVGRIKVFIDTLMHVLKDSSLSLYRSIPPFKYKEYVLIIVLALIISVLIILIMRTLHRVLKVDHLKKGDRYMSRCKYEKARKRYLKVNAFTKAAFCSLKLTRIEEAADFFIRGKEFEMAAKYYALDGKFKKAAGIYEKLGKRIEAAEMYFKNGDIEKSAQIYRGLNLLKKAEEMYVKLDKHLEVARMYKEKFLKEHSSLPKNPPPRRLEKVKVLALKAGQYFNRLGQYEEALKIFLKNNQYKEAIIAFEKMEDFVKAADLCIQIDDHERAAEYFVKGKKYDRAIEIYKDLKRDDEVAKVLELAGRNAEAAELKAKLSLERADIEHGAKHFEEAGKFTEAADLYASINKLERAAELYEKGNNIEKAAEVHEDLENHKKAAELYRSINRFKSAAHCYRQTEDDRSYLEMLLLGESYLDAARFYDSKGQKDQAIEVLQKIDADSPDYYLACNLLGRLFADKNIIGIAREKLSEAVEKKEISKRNLELFYDLAVFQESHGEEEKALKIYEKILSHDFYFKDVQDRRSILESKVTSDKDSSSDSFLSGGQRKPAGQSQKDEVINNRYELMGEIGRGGMGVVYKALDRSLDRAVALKFLPSDFIRDTRDIEKFINEAKSAAKLNHRNIVTIHNIDQVGSDYFIVMELVDGANLKEIIDMAHNLPYKTIHMIAEQICDALDYAHKNNVIHRDIKNANIMWTNEKIVKITDFGLAKIIEDGLKTSTRVQGSPVYMSPEQVLGKDIDLRTDIYSLGVSLYEMSTGKVPFERGDIGYHHLNTIPEPPEAIRSDMPEYLSKMIRKCLNKRPEERYQSAKELLEELKVAT